MEESTIDMWKRKIDTLKVQLDLGSKEAAEAFQEKKKEMGEWAKSTRSSMGDFTSEQSKKISTMLGELEVQAALAKAEGKDAIEAQSKKMNELYGSLKTEFKHIAKSTSEESHAIAQKASAQLDKWEGDMEMLNVRMHLAGKDASDAWQEKKSKLNAELREMENKLTDAKNQGAETWSKVSDEVKSKWDSFKSKFSS